jgi:hypothetical protein
MRGEKSASDNSAVLGEVLQSVKKLLQDAENNPAKARQLIGVDRLSRVEISNNLEQAKAYMVSSLDYSLFHDVDSL